MDTGVYPDADSITMFMMQPAVNPSGSRARGAPVAQVLWYQLPEAPPSAEEPLIRSVRLFAPQFQLHQRPARTAVSYRLSLVVTRHKQRHGFRKCLFVRLTAQLLDHHLRASVGDREWERRVGWGIQSPARPAAGPDENVD